MAVSKPFPFFFSLRLRRAPTFTFSLNFVTMRFAVVSSLALLAGSVAASPLMKREGCQMLACVIKVAPLAASCSPAIAANGLDMDADFTCLKDSFQFLTSFPTECDGCILEVLKGKFDLGNLDLGSLGIDEIKDIFKNIDLGNLPPLTIPTSLPDLGDILTNLPIPTELPSINIPGIELPSELPKIELPSSLPIDLPALPTELPKIEIPDVGGILGGIFGKLRR
ncbi:hypothetical protein BKA62DRAFT_720580 [Auriculariales sp. MPI-PUGE-AT-0066]|nr:hypothetical protein BKA62DRAFT_720580 [Auriculariales sp. MPI-PUGE-AT-0066]